MNSSAFRVLHGLRSKHGYIKNSLDFGKRRRSAESAFTDDRDANVGADAEDKKKEKDHGGLYSCFCCFFADIFVCF